jgi:hypothetical protein
MLYALITLVILFAVLTLLSSLYKVTLHVGKRPVDPRLDFAEISDLNPEYVDQVRNLLESATEILAKIRNDASFCVPLSRDVGAKRGEILIPEAGAHTNGGMFGDVTFEKPVPVHIENKHLRRMKAITRDVDALMSKLSMVYQTRGTGDVSYDTTRLIRRITKTWVGLDSTLKEMQSEVIVACAEQKERIRSVDERLAKYTLRDESVHDPDTIPRYEYGRSVRLTRRVDDSPFPYVDSQVAPTTNPTRRINEMNQRPAEDAMRIL